MGETSINIILIIFNIIFIAFIGAIVVFIREYRIKKRVHLKEIEHNEFLHQKELLKTQTEIQKETMQYIGREIHDNIGQRLTLASIYLQQLIFENKITPINNHLDDINTIIHESLNELRQLSKSLTNDLLKNYTIVELINQECEKINQLKACKVNFENNLYTDIESYQVKSVVLRITQEFFQNSLKHSKCKQIDLKLSAKNNILELFLKDDGIGFDLEQDMNKGIGLKNIKKRVEMINGAYHFHSDNHGTCLTLKITT